MTITQGMTLEAFLKLPEEEPALEFADGMVTQKVSPKLHHSAVQLGLGKRIDFFAEPRKLARAFTELRTTFAGASRVPDVAVFLWERIPRDASGRLAQEVFSPPDIAIEIVSPEQSVRELTAKCRWYVANGVRIALLVDPERERVTVFRPNAESRTLRGTDRIDLDDVLPGFQLSVDELFAALS
jgi:Uma2 family endonuclease